MSFIESLTNSNTPTGYLLRGLSGMRLPTAPTSVNYSGGKVYTPATLPKVEQPVVVPAKVAVTQPKTTAPISTSKTGVVKPKPKATTAPVVKKPVTTSVPPATAATAAGLAQPVSINTSNSMPQVSDASIPIGGSIIANDGIARDMDGVPITDFVSTDFQKYAQGLVGVQDDRNNWGSTPKWESMSQTVNTEPGMFDGFGKGLADLWGGTSVDAAGNKITTGIGGAEGFSNLMGGLSAGSGIYNGLQQNKRADEALNMMKQDRANQYKANADWNKNIASSTLGLASRATM
jgi:hypothetical protein